MERFIKFIIISGIVFLSNINDNKVAAQCYYDQSDEYWYIGPEYGSHKITPCASGVVYNCHGFVLSYFENNCRPGISETIPSPYNCPTAQGNKSTGTITNSGKFVEVCSSSEIDIVTYDLYGGDVHSAVKVTEESGTKYISKYGTDGPLVSHDLYGSWYHYTTTVSSPKYWAYIGEISGDTEIEGTGNVSFSVNDNDDVDYSWSIISGGSNIYIYSGSTQNTVTLKPVHSGTATLKLEVDSSCGEEESQTVNLTIETNICLEGTYTNAGSGPYNLQTGNSVSTGSVMTTVSCPNATSYTWERTSGSLSYYANGSEMSFTMTSGTSISFEIKAKNSSQQVIGTRNVSYYNYGSYMIFPNPGDLYFEIDVTSGVELDIIVFDEDKQIFKEIQGYKAGSKIDTSKWPKGEYYIHIYHNKGKVKEQRFRIDK